MTRTLARLISDRSPTWGEVTYYYANDRARRDVIATYRHRHGFKRRPVPMFGDPADNLKSDKATLPEATLSLSPARESGISNTCPFSTPQCRSVCVAHNGNGRYSSVQRARAWKTDLLAHEPEVAIAQMMRDAERLGRRHPDGWCLRPNTFSDVPWEALIPAPFWSHLVDHGCRYVIDYTKNPHRTSTILAPDLPYHIAYSANERTPHDLPTDRPVAVVVALPKATPVPASYQGRPVIDADESDEWIAQAQSTNAIGMVRAKGKARALPADVSGTFVRLVTV